MSMATRAFALMPESILRTQDANHALPTLQCCVYVDGQGASSSSLPLLDGPVVAANCLFLKAWRHRKTWSSSDLKMLMASALAFVKSFEFCCFAKQLSLTPAEACNFTTLRGMLRDSTDTLRLDDRRMPRSRCKWKHKRLQKSHTASRRLCATHGCTDGAYARRTN